MVKGSKNDVWLFLKISLSLNHCFLQNVKIQFCTINFQTKWDFRIFHAKGFTPFNFCLKRNRFLTFCKKQWFRLIEIFENNQKSFLTPDPQPLFSYTKNHNFAFLANFSPWPGSKFSKFFLWSFIAESQVILIFISNFHKILL